MNLEKIADELADKIVLGNQGVGNASALIQAALTAMLEGFGGDGVTEWECFCDAGYFDMWCVREVGERRFGYGFHLVNGDEAQGLCDHLNEQARHRQLSAAAERARIVAAFRELTWSCPDDMNAALRLADAIERGEV